MKNEKDLNVSSPETDEQIESSLDRSDSYEEQQLQVELEKLAETFRSELQKAKETGEVKVAVNQVVDENDNVIPEEEICECCGERRKDVTVSSGYPFCTECREKLKRYPFNSSSIITAVAVFVVAIFCVMAFVTDFEGYNLARNAKNANKNVEKYTAVDYYVEASTIFEEKSVMPKLLYRECAANIFSTLPEGVKSFQQTAELIDNSMTSFEAKLPIFKNYIDLRDRATTMYETFNAFYAIYNNTEYAGLTPEDEENVLKLYNEIGALNGKEFTIKNIHDEDVTTTYDEASVLFAQFMFAYSYGLNNEAYDSLKVLNEKYPELISMYGYELAVLEIQSGNFKEANELAKRLIQQNKEDSSPYDIYAYNYRMHGNYEKSITYCDIGLERNATNTDLYRQKAISLLLSGDKKGSLEVIEEGIAQGNYAIMYCTGIIIANENGDSAKVEEMKGKLTESGIKLPEKVQKYLDGELSYKKLFTEGTGDIE